MTSVKISVSLPDEDLTFLDEYAHRAGIPSRSSALHEAVSLLRLADLEQAYERAWDEWETSEDAEAWASAVADGLGDASR